MMTTWTGHGQDRRPYVGSSQFLSIQICSCWDDRENQTHLALCETTVDKTVGRCVLQLIPTDYLSR
jgi:hypothetical protein